MNPYEVPAPCVDSSPSPCPGNGKLKGAAESLETDKGNMTAIEKAVVAWR